MLSGANDLRSIWRWGRRLTPKGLAMLGIDRGRAPCHATYLYVFRAIPAADLERAPGAAVRLDGSLGHVAIDGKRLRGSQHETSPGVHMLQAFSIRLQASIGSLVVPPDSGEVVEALKLLKDLPLEGAVLTGDAAFTTEKIARAIREGGGHYFLFGLLATASSASGTAPSPRTPAACEPEAPRKTAPTSGMPHSLSSDAANSAQNPEERPSRTIQRPQSVPSSNHESTCPVITPRSAITRA